MIGFDLYLLPDLPVVYIMGQHLSIFSSFYFSYRILVLNQSSSVHPVSECSPPVVNSKSKYIFELDHWLQTLGNVKLGVDNEVNFSKG